ncbi:uncharacterized protein [Diabrotica undecimpunctata]|uniref:uncharacterized protein n=1 Tax=Diabrotica undecimpunctata TaxID=50387 RepID=UPI003B6359DA
MTLVSYYPKRNKSFILVSSMHHDNAIDPKTGDSKKPDIVTRYNKTKIGVNCVDQLCVNYNVARNTCRWPWPMVIFFDLLNISGINALCVYKGNHPFKTKVKRSEVIEQFAWKLIKPQIEARSTNTYVPVELRRRARPLLGIEAPPAPPAKPEN